MRGRRDDGQALLLLVAALAAVLVGAWALGALARGVGVQGSAQRAADLGALSGARAMHDAYSRLFEPASLAARPNPRHLERAAYLGLGRAAATRTARLNGARVVRVSFPDGGSIAPVRVRVAIEDPVRVPAGGHTRTTRVAAVAEAELAPAGGGIGVDPGAGDYRGPFAYRQGKPMRPDVAGAFDRLARAARSAGISLIINSAWRSSREQAALFARHPDPRWVARPGHSLHRLGTELDLGPPGAYGWLLRNAPRFHFVRRYPWEPWHFGYALNAGSGSVGFGRRAGGGDGRSAVPSFVPASYAAPISAAAQRWNVSAALLAAQIYAESNFNPFAVSPAGARGIAQFMPGTAAAYGLRNPFDAARAIDAQAHLMRDLLRRFGSVPLALAAYNAGPEPVARCGCVPAIPETRGYVARILGLLGGAGQIGGGTAGLEVRLVR
ncbi:MAG: hypothetical protein QOK31_1973 [Solirubrobacteraceae bacterium]|nr:hypothetical protein [Solirubrobacteraceae bacterium]